MLTAIGCILAGMLSLVIFGATLFVFGMFFCLVMEGFECKPKKRGGNRNVNV